MDMGGEGQTVLPYSGQTQKQNITFMLNNKLYNPVCLCKARNNIDTCGGSYVEPFLVHLSSAWVATYSHSEEKLASFPGLSPQVFISLAVKIPIFVLQVIQSLSVD